jgi:thiamine pyrophosphokinase
MKRCVIIGASPDAYWDHRWTPKLVFYADGGVRHTARLGLRPDVVIGDRDSSKYADIILPAEKKITDTEACIDHALASGCDEIALLGATGGRLDHFLGNIGLLEKAGGRMFILDYSHEIRLIGGGAKIDPPHRYRYFSVIPLDETVEGVTISGAKYPLENAVLHRSATMGVSNEPLEGTSVAVSVKNGRALLVLSEKIS